VKSVFFDSVLDGLNEARFDLQPESELLVDLDEFVDGLGDGAVTVERGRLEGVDDTIVLSPSHGSITSALEDEDSRRLVAEKVARLARR
jgi:hypothetical protein